MERWLLAVGVIVALALSSLALLRGDKETPGTQATVEALDQRIRALEASRSLEVQASTVNRGKGKGGLIAGQRPDNAEDLAMAIENLERRLATLEQAPIAVPSAIAQLREDPLAYKRAGQSVVQQGEALLAAEPDVANDYYADRVAEAFEAMDGTLEARSLECRGSVCRVEYKTDAGAGGGSDDKLVGELMSALGEGQLRLLHGTDPQGNQLLYIDLRP